MKIIQTDILTVEADAIVNPANSFLRHGGGLAKVIADAAAPAEKNPGMDEREWYSQERRSAASWLWLGEQSKHPNIPTGGVGVTSAGALPFKAIIHAVGPIWGGGSYCEEHLLFAAHRNAFDRVLELGMRSVVVPAISCGIFGYPVDRAARIAVLCADAYDDVLDITFALFSDEHYAAYMAAAVEKGIVVA